MDQTLENHLEEDADLEAVVLGISIVNFHSLDSVRSLIASLADFAAGMTVEVCIVDNSLDADAKETSGLKRLAESFAREDFVIQVQRSTSNLGYGAGNNLAVANLLERGAGLIWVLNPDTTVSGSASELVAEIRQSQSRIWATSTIEKGAKSSGLGTLNTLTGKGRTSSKATLGQRQFSFEYPAGHSILFKRDAWLNVGGFDDRYFLFMEEADLTLRAQSLGIPIGVLSSIAVNHAQGLTTGSTDDVMSKSVTAFREATKSRIIFFRRFYRQRLPFLILTRLVYAALIRAKGNHTGSKAVVDGLVAGIRYQHRVEAGS